MAYRNLLMYPKRVGLALMVFLVLLCTAALPATVSADPCQPNDKTQGNATPAHCCGEPSQQVGVAINFGCQSKGNPILDMLFAVIRFLSAGIGLVLVASMIWAGIQYTTSRSDPQATAAAQNRIRNNVIALLLFIFAFALVNYVVPGQLLQ